MGAYYSLHKDLDKLEEATSGYKKEKFYSFLQPTLKGGFVKGGKVRKIFEYLLDGRDFVDLQIPMVVCTTDLVAGKEFNIESGPLAPAVQASMAIPVVYKLIEYMDRMLVDGGLCNPVPDDTVRKMEANIVVAINLEIYLNDYFNTDKLTVAKAMLRSFNIGRHYLSEYAIQNSDFVIAPTLPVRGFVGWKKFFIDKVDKDIIKRGEQAADKIISELKREVFNK